MRQNNIEIAFPIEAILEVKIEICDAPKKLDFPDQKTLTFRSPSC
jgi:hypothetical protein